MPFWTDAIRVVGFVAAPVLAATGVGIPLAVGIGAVAAGAANAGADAIERDQANNQADRDAAEARRQAEAILEQQRIAAERRAREVQEALERQLAQAALPSRIITACQAEQMDAIPGLLQQLDAGQFDQLSVNLVAACPSAASQQRMVAILDNERRRRGIA